MYPDFGCLGPLGPRQPALVIITNYTPRIRRFVIQRPLPVELHRNLDDAGVARGEDLTKCGRCQ